MTTGAGDAPRLTETLIACSSEVAAVDSLKNTYRRTLETFPA